MYSWGLARDMSRQEAGEEMEQLFYEIQVNNGAPGGWLGWPLKEPWGHGSCRLF